MADKRGENLGVGRRWYQHAGKVDNNPGAMVAKVELREHVLKEMGAEQAHVFDAYCGTGEMYRAVWSRAASYVGCDGRQWRKTDPPRFVADNRRLMRAIDLSRFNVFDFDAYGSPWEQMVVLAARRKWAQDERGAVILTDGTGLKLGFGQVPHAMIELTGVTSVPPGVQYARDLQAQALKKWTERCKVEPLRIWVAEAPIGRPASKSRTGTGGNAVIYTGMVFTGSGE